MTTLHATQADPTAHLTSADVENLGRELDAIRAEVIASSGERDAAYIRKSIHIGDALQILSLRSIGKGNLQLGNNVIPLLPYYV